MVGRGEPLAHTTRELSALDPATLGEEELIYSLLQEPADGIEGESQNQHPKARYPARFGASKRVRDEEHQSTVASKHQRERDAKHHGTANEDADIEELVADHRVGNREQKKQGRERSDIDPTEVIERVR